MARVPITMMGFRCERCGHEWLPQNIDYGPASAQLKCHSPYWNIPGKKGRMSYEDFKEKIADVLRHAGKAP